MVRILVLGILAAIVVWTPDQAAAERIHTRDGRVIVGTPRFEGEWVIVEQEDGSELRLDRRDVVRIDLEDEPAGEPPPTPRLRDPRPPPPPVRRPPPPPAPPSSVGRRMLEKQGFETGLAMKFGYQRGMAIGGEWQQRLGRFVGLGLGAQGALAVDQHVVCPTWGITSRIYLGHRHRFVGEAGLGLNRIDPYFDFRRLPGPDPFDDVSCGDAEVNIGPEISLGYQWVSRGGFLFEALGGVAPIVNDALADEHNQVAGLFTLNLGFVFR